MLKVAHCHKGACVCISSTALDQLISAEYLRCRQTRPPVQLIPVVSSNRGKYKHCDCEQSRADLLLRCLAVLTIRGWSFEAEGTDIHSGPHSNTKDIIKGEPDVSKRLFHWTKGSLLVKKKKFFGLFQCSSHWERKVVFCSPKVAYVYSWQVWFN